MSRLVAFRVRPLQFSLTHLALALACLLLPIAARAQLNPQYGSLSACSNMTVGTPAYGPNGGGLNSFVPFPSTNAWNTNISTASIDPNSTALTGVWATAGNYPLTPLFGELPSDGGIPYIVVNSAATPSVPINVIDSWNQSDVVIAPIPGSDAVPIEGDGSDCAGWPDDHITNAHALVLDAAQCWLYETYNTNRCNGFYNASSEAIWDMTESESRPWGWTSADAGGLPVFAGLVRYDEANSGVINHAIAFTMNPTAGDASGGYFVLPASAANSSNTTVNLLPMGATLRLHSSIDISGYSPINQAILTAMMNYGLILSDVGDNFNILGDTDANWADSDLANLSAIMSSDFDVIDAPAGTSTMTPAYPGMDAVSAPTDYPGTAPTINSFTVTPYLGSPETGTVTISPGTSVTFNFNVTGDSYDYIDNIGPVRLTAGSGSVTITPTASQEYTLYSTNATGRNFVGIDIVVTGTTVAPPTFTPPGANYASGSTLAVTLNTTTAGNGPATFYYTTNGTAPTTGSTKYNGASIKVKASETLEAIAVVPGYASPSAVSTAVYTIGLKTPDNPVFNPPSGTYTTILSVVLSDSTVGTGNTGNKIYYTTDGTTPTTASKQYLSPITVAKSETLNAIAVATGYTVSAVSSAAYTLNLPPDDTPVLSPPTGTYSSPQTVTISDAIPNSTIYYTTGGLTPTTASPIYTGPFVVYGSASPTTVEAVAIATGYGLSGVGSATYTIPQVLPALVTPTPGTQLAGASVTFHWTTGDVGATQYELTLGSTGQGSSNLYNSGAVTGTTANVTGLPTNGETIYATLSFYINGTWFSAFYTYTASGTPTPAALVTPTPGSVLPAASVAFTWTPGNVATQFQFTLGSTGPGSSNLYHSGTVSVLTENVAGLPVNGETVYATLYWLINGTWYSANYTYTAYGTTQPAQLTTPSPGSTLSGSTVTFGWTPGNAASAFQLYVGTTAIGSNNIFNSGNLTGTSVSVSGLPTNGKTVYVELQWLIGSTWHAANYTYTASGGVTLPTLTTPTPGTTFTSTSETFKWTTGSGGATHYELYLGTTSGASNLYNSGVLTGTSVTVTGLPTNGETVYARLFWEIGTVWNSTIYTYKAK
jgi:LysM repeat protein